MNAVIGLVPPVLDVAAASFVNILLAFLPVLGIYAHVARVPVRGSLSSHLANPRGLRAQAKDVLKAQIQSAGDDSSKKAAALERLAQLERWEALMANQFEHLTVFAVTLAVAMMANVPQAFVSSFVTLVICSRMLYHVAYVLIPAPAGGVLRSAAFWIGTGACLAVCWEASRITGGAFAAQG